MIWLSSDLRFKWFWLSSDLRFNWFGCQLIWDSNDLVVNRCVLQMILVVCWFELQLMWLSIDWDSSDLVVIWFEIQVIWLSKRFEIQLIWLWIDLRFKWFGCQSMCASNDFGCLLTWTSSDVVVNWFEIQVIRLSIDLRFKWFGCQLIWDSNELVVNWFEIQVIWMSNDLRFKWFGCQLMSDSNDFVKRSFSARLPSKLKLWSLKTKLLCETSFKNEALKLKNKTFLRDFLQKWSFEDQKPSISARLPSKMKRWRSKAKHFCETSLKNQALKLKNEAFLRDFLQKCSFATQKRNFFARLPSKCKLSRWKTKLFCGTSFKNEALKIKNEAFLRDFLQKWHVDQTLDLRIPIRFSDFQVNASKVLRLPRKSWAEAYELL